MGILYRYVLRELFGPFILILFVLTGVLFLGRSLKLVELIINKTASLFQIVTLFSYVVPQFLEMAIPMAFLLSIIITFGRLSADSELVVMRSVGLSLRKLLIPLSLFSIICFSLNLIISLWLRPLSSYQLGLGLFQLASAQISSGLHAGQFNSFGPFTIYARQTLDNGSKLKDVLIADDRDPKLKRVFIANNAAFASNPGQRSLRIRLYDGVMQEGSGLSMSQTHYETTTIALSENDLAQKDSELRRTKTKEKSTGQLLREKAEMEAMPQLEADPEKLDHYKHVRVELQKRLVLPASCLSIGLLALCLGIQSSRGNNKWGNTISVLLGILMILLYYILYAVVSAVAEETGEYTEVIMWIPNLLYVLMGAYLFQKLSTEHWSGISDRIMEIGNWMQNKKNRSDTSS